MPSKTLVFFFLFAGLWADDFTCPKDKITIAEGTTGSIPKGATSMMKFAANTNCIFTFTIPKGYAIKMELSATYEASPGDYVKFDHFFVPYDGEKDLEYAIGPELNVSFLSVTGNLTFFAQYSYLDLSGFSKVIQKTGYAFNTTLQPSTYYTVQAADGDTVTWNLAMRDTGFYDSTIYELMMFDGPDIINSEYIGRVSEYSRSFDFHSETNTLTFLNLYGTPSNSFILANDYSKIKGLPQYHTWVVDPTKETNGSMYNQQGKTDAYYTFICDGCTQFYIEYIYFGNESAVDGYIEVQGMSPTQALPVVLNYTNSPFTNMSLPQLIPSPMATFHTHKADVQFVFKTELQSGYFAAGNDKKRSVYSPKLWNPNADQQFDYTFQDPVKVFNFSINLESVKLIEDADELIVQVGSANGLTTLDKKYTKTAISNQPLSGMGRYLHLKYTGSPNSEVIINFEEIDPNAPTVTPGPSTQSVPTSPVGSSVSSVAPTSTQVSTSTSPPSTSAPTTMSTGAATSTQVSTASSTASSTAPITTAPTSATSQPTSTTEKVIQTSTSTPLATTTTVGTSTVPSTTTIISSTITSSPVPTTTSMSTSTSTLSPSTSPLDHSTSTANYGTSTSPLATSTTPQLTSTVVTSTLPTSTVSTTVPTSSSTMPPTTTTMSTSVPPIPSTSTMPITTETSTRMLTSTPTASSSTTTPVPSTSSTPVSTTTFLITSTTLLTSTSMQTTTMSTSSSPTSIATPVVSTTLASTITTTVPTTTTESTTEATSTTASTPNVSSTKSAALSTVTTSLSTKPSTMSTSLTSPTTSITPTSNSPSSPSSTARSSRLPSTYTSAPATKDTKDAASVTTPSVRTTTSAVSSTFTGFLLLVTFCINRL